MSSSKYNYKNVMEMLVEEEVARQLEKLPPKVAAYLRSVEIVTYALNRLPTLYACSERGLEQQLKKAKQEQGPQIVKTVHWAIKAVQQDPLRKFVPIQTGDQDQILSELRTLLNDPQINWDNLPQAVEQALNHFVHSESSNTKEDITAGTQASVQTAINWQDYKKRRSRSNYNPYDTD